ncbi:hypothetical protein BXZ70DRAFT_503421 [Cristinia sonorae]|uniref:BTB domain-containing protein n=1 Tax=Cristinia sonorae TaxID=1940300 RepID=A0A8K0UHJ6_9AGAR|nr:hypothetical protein BXZ70DRAFT_503421 [Cristinia sonorae]
MTEQPRKANPPFDRDDADILFRTSDLVDFSIHKLILSISSPVFADMFSLATSNHPDDWTNENGVTIVTVSESSRVLELLLRFLYPVENPSVGTLAEIADVLEVANKYEVSFLITSMTAALHSFLETEPLRVFAVACRLGMEDDAKLAATHALALVESTALGFHFVDEMKDISAGAYYRLVRFLKHGPGGPPEYSSFIRPHPHDPDRGALEVVHPDSPDRVLKAWTAMNLFTSHPADVVIRCSDGGQLPAHKLVVSLMSPVLDEQMKLLTDPMPILDVSEPSYIVQHLLRSCYGFTCGDYAFARYMERTNPVVHLVHAARKYKMSRTIENVRRTIPQYADCSPELSYFNAAKLGWVDEARRTAMAWSQSGDFKEQNYYSQLETVPAKAYFALLKYMREVKVLKELLDNRFKGRPEERQMKNELYTKSLSDIPLHLL